MPAYGGGEFKNYTWVRVAGPEAIDRVQAALDVTEGEFIGKLYWLADSNRFTADALWHARLSLDPFAQQALGWVPAFAAYSH